jgi:CubicO group peptidase (beta-lactamase class C family)
MNQSFDRYVASFIAASIAVSCGGGGVPTAKTPQGSAPSVANAPASAMETPAAAIQSAAKELVATNDTAVELGSKAALTVPKGWIILQQSPELVHVTGPERDIDIFFVDGTEVDSRDQAVAQAWKKVSGAPSKIADQATLPGRDGWDAMSQIVCVTPTQESRAVVAVALQLGKRWYVHIVRGTNAAIGRRGAQLGTLIESFKVPGMKKESLVGKTAKLDSATLNSFSEFVDEARNMSNVPGVAIAVVSGDKILLEKGFGVKTQGGQNKITPNTKFMIGSTTKSLTTLMMARLVDAQKFDWNTSVTKLMPSFALGDARTTAAVTMQNTVCACTGMPRRDLEFIFQFDNISAEARIASMKEMQPTTGFGETFQYSNLMVSAGGYVAAKSAEPGKNLDAAYDAVMKREVVTPLGMTSTTFDMKTAQRGDFALPHGQSLSVDMQYTPFPLHTEEAVAAVRPAGAAWSTVRDLARYVQLELGKGKVNGKQLVSELNMQLRITPQIKISDTESYGLGLFIGKDAGVVSLGHGGNTIGFTSDLFWLPEHNVGVIMLSNAGQASETAVYGTCFRRKTGGQREFGRRTCTRQKSHC